jgi:acylphosphatase
MQKGLEILVKGKVQGVWFRASAQKEAKALSLTGWVQNESDGSVRLQAYGAEADLALMAAWCHSGPVHAKVDKVIITDVPYRLYEDFIIRRR